MPENRPKARGRLTGHFGRAAPIRMPPKPPGSIKFQVGLDLAFGHPKQADGLDPDLMTAPGQRLRHVPGRPPAAAADRRPFVAKHQNAEAFGLWGSAFGVHLSAVLVVSRIPLSIEPPAITLTISGKT